jgi:hypothetical protein
MAAADFPRIAVFLRDLEPDERRALVMPLKKCERYELSLERQVVPAAPVVAADGRTSGYRARSVVRHWSVFTLAAAGVFPTAAALAPWIKRYGLSGFVDSPDNRMKNKYDVVTLLVDLLRARNVPWLGDLAERVTRPRTVSADTVRLVEALAAESEIDIPATDSMVLALATPTVWTTPIEAGPKWDPLLLRTFEVDGVGRLLVSGQQEPNLAQTIAVFTAEGRLDRPDVIDRCLGALKRGGPPADLAGYLAVYWALRPALAEITARMRDYLSLLADGYRPVAGMAQTELFQVHDAGLLDIEFFLEASHVVFLRGEKKIVRAQFDRFRKALNDAPEAVDDVVLVLAEAFHHEASDVRKGAVTLAMEYASRVSRQTRKELAVAAAGLPAGYREAALAVFGEADLPS